MLPFAVLGTLAARLSRSPRLRSRRKAKRRSTSRTTPAEECHELLEEGEHGRRLPRVAEPAASRDERDHLGLARVPRAARRHVEVGYPGRQEHDADARGADPHRPRAGRESAKAESEARRCSSTRRNSPRRATKPAASSKKRGSRPTRSRRDLKARAEEEARGDPRARHADIDLQRERAIAELRGDVATISIELAERIVERNLDRDTQMQLVDSFIDQVREQLGDGRPRRRLRPVAARDRERRRAPRRGRGRAVPFRPDRRRATTSCAWRSRTGRSRPSGGPRSSTSCSRPQALHDHRRDHLVRRRCRSRCTTCTAIVNRFVELAAQTRQHEVAEVRSAVALDDAQTAAPGRGVERSDRQADRGEGRGRREGDGRHRRDDRRHGDRRHRASPARAAEGDDVTDGAQRSRQREEERP